MDYIIFLGIIVWAREPKLQRITYNFRGGPMIKSKEAVKKGGEIPSTSNTLSQIKFLINGLRNEDGIVRHKARRALTFIGKRAVPDLIPLLRDPNDDVRWEAAKALSEIIAPGAAPDLVATLDDHNYGVRWLAAEGLIAIGQDALPPLLKSLTERSDSAWIREGAHHVLHDLADKDLRVKNLAAPVIAALEGIEPEIGVVEPAYAALDKLKVPAKKVQLRKAKPRE
jgi:HEAT repeat protein